MLTKNSLRFLILLPALLLGVSACTTFGTVAEDSSIESRVKDRIYPILEKTSQMQWMWLAIIFMCSYMGKCLVKM